MPLLSLLCLRHGGKAHCTGAHPDFRGRVRILTSGAARNQLGLLTAWPGLVIWVQSQLGIPRPGRDGPRPYACEEFEKARSLAFNSHAQIRRVKQHPTNRIGLGNIRYAPKKYIGQFQYADDHARFRFQYAAFDPAPGSRITTTIF